MTTPRALRVKSSACHSALVDVVFKRLEYERDLKLYHLRQSRVAPRPNMHATFWGLAPGAPDLYGMLGPNGRVFGIECKTGEAGLEPDQIEFAATVRRLGGFCTVVRSVHEALAALARARKGERE